MAARFHTHFPQTASSDAICGGAGDRPGVALSVTAPMAGGQLTKDLGQTARTTNSIALVQRGAG